MNKNIQTEVDARYLYQKLAENETEETIANVYRQMSEIEKGHAQAFLQKQKNKNGAVLPPPSFRAKSLNTIGKIFGYNYVLGALMDTEKSISIAVINAKNKNKLPVTGAERNHVTILRSLLESESKVTGGNLAHWVSNHD